MSTSFFKGDEKLSDSSNIVAWKIRLEVILYENDILEYVEGKVPEPPENAPVVAKSKYKKDEIKAKEILIDSLKDHLLTYVGKFNKSKDIHHKPVGMYDVNNLNHILSLKNQLKDIKMNKGEFLQSYVMRILHTVGEPMSDKELVSIIVQGLPPIWETFITTISNNDKLPTFNELVGKCTLEETRMISRGRIQKHEDEEPSAFSAQDKKRKGRGRTSNSRKLPPDSRDSNRRFKKELSKVECYNCHKHGHYA